MGLFSALTKTWSDGYQFGDILKSVGYDLNPLAWGLNKLNDKMFGANNYEVEHGGPDVISDGIVNTWNKMTGNAHLTPEYQHAEEREDSVNQRIAQDLMSAGLSKFSMNPAPVGTSNASNGLTMLDAVSKIQDIKAQSFALKQAKYNLGLSKKLGIRTGDKNSLAQLTSIMSALFGLNLDDVPENGIVPWFFQKLFGGNSGNGSEVGAFLDTSGSAMKDASSVNPLSDPTKIESHGLLSVGDVEKKFVGVLSKVTNNFTSDVNGANLKKVMDSSVSSLEKQGYTWLQSAEMVNSWLRRYLKNYDNLEWNLYITKTRKDYTDSFVSVPSTTSRPSGGGHAW